MIKRPPFMLASIAVLGVLFASGRGIAAEKIRMAYVSPSVSLSIPWMAKETGLLAKHDLTAEVLLITGSPRPVAHCRRWNSCSAWPPWCPARAYI